MESRSDVYRIKLIESSSPLSTRPSTPFRLGALCLMQREHCYMSPGTENEMDDSKPYDLPVITDYIPPVCDLAETKIFLSEYVGKTDTHEIDHGDNAPYFSHYTVPEEYEGVLNIKVKRDEVSVKILEEFYGEFPITVHYSNCLECSFTVVVDTLEPLPCTSGTKAIAPEVLPNGNLRWELGHGDRRELFDKLVQLDGKELVELVSHDADHMEFKVLKNKIDDQVKMELLFTDGVVCPMTLHLDIESDEYENGDGEDNGDYGTPKTFAIKVCDAATLGFRVKLTVDGEVMLNGLAEYIDKNGQIQNYEAVGKVLSEYGYEYNLHPLFELKDNDVIEVNLEILDPKPNTDASEGKHVNALNLDVYLQDDGGDDKAESKVPSGLHVEFDKGITEITDVRPHRDSSSYWGIDYVVKGRTVDIKYTKLK